MSGNTSPISPRNQVQQFSNLGSDSKEKLNSVDNLVDIVEVQSFSGELGLDSKKESFNSNLKLKEIVDLSSSEILKTKSNFTSNTNVDLEIISPPNFLGIDKEDAVNQITYYKAIKGISEENNVLNSSVMDVYSNYKNYDEKDNLSIDEKIGKLIKEKDYKSNFGLYMLSFTEKFDPKKMTFLGIGASAEPITEYLRQSGTQRIGNIPISGVTDEHYELMCIKPNERSLDDQKKIDLLKQYVIKAYPHLENPQDKTPILLMDATDQGNTLKVMKSIIKELCPEREVRMLALNNTVKSNIPGNQDIEIITDEMTSVKKKCREIFDAITSNSEIPELLPPKIQSNYVNDVKKIYLEDNEPSFSDCPSVYNISASITSQNMKKDLENNGVRVFPKIELDNILSGAIKDPLDSKPSKSAAYSLGKMISLILE